MMAKGLKTITSLNCIYIMLSLFGLSYALGNNQPELPSPVPARSEVVRSGGSELTTPEQPKTDIWQTSYETNNSKKSDYEDAEFL
ncbi:MAG: hypothetical protein NUV86_02495 [Candidatus Scalindua sp.]|nr:hypothetical protein [Candidatus Scalindua sp.]MCR4343206.1 hypothetical protein [Candidatus Scalindua sp.]